MSTTDRSGTIIKIDKPYGLADAIAFRNQLVKSADAGEKHAIFDKNAHLHLAQPGNYEAVLSLIQDLGPVTDNHRKVVKKEGFKTPIPELIATFPADQVTPACRQMTYDT